MLDLYSKHLMLNIWFRTGTELSVTESKGWCNRTKNTVKRDFLINIPTIAGSVNSNFQFKLHPCVRLGIFVNSCYLTRKEKLHHLALIRCIWQIYFSIICGIRIGTGRVLHVLLLERKMKVESLPQWFVASQSFEWVSIYSVYTNRL